MEITFSGTTNQNIFGEVLNYQIRTSICGVTIYDDFKETSGHQRTRVRTKKRHLYVKQYKPWNQVILVR